MIDPREEDIISSFLEKSRRERARFLISHPDRRDEFLGELYHFRSLEPKFCQAIPRSESSIEGICKSLRQKGAKSKAYCMSTETELDGQEVGLEVVIELVRGKGAGTIALCLPGKLAYYEGEDEALILERG